MTHPLRQKSHLLKEFFGFFLSGAGVAIYAFTHATALRLPAVRQTFYRQILFTGIQALLPVAVAGLVVGSGLLSQMCLLLGSGADLNVKMMQLVVFREFAPLLTSFIVLGRSGSAIATELASMKVQGEIRLLYLLGINPGEYLLVPRILACCVAVPMLTFVFQLVAVLAGPVIASLIVDLPLQPFYAALGNQISLGDIVLSLTKTFTLGLIIASVACSIGIYVPMKRTWIPQAAELSVLRSFILVLLADLAFAAISLLGS
ncbi:MAG: ABC transporter permease [Luteolibacter sp.]